ncbi:PA domain-containing protein [Nakamurella panacisegetis]|uniref:PA domain-containing protein n=1 Tax=Nakamurella panacisegetis TaxID=1090615 RepID=A0A1H0HXK4_9ACTN|nr:S8 family serine peptidase [Nakamurella panacisegetis]SDO23853.1 PA domain-containing protein [Nakamurella panacisegetis]
MRTAGLAALLMAAGLAAPSGPAASATDPTDSRPVADAPAQPGPMKPGYSNLTARNAVLQPTLAAGSGEHTVFVQLPMAGAADVYDSARARGESTAQVSVAVAGARSAISALAASVSATAAAADPDAVTTFVVTNAVPGLGLTADPAALRAVAARSDVVQVSEIVPKSPANAGAAQLTRALASWTDLGVTGRGVRIGVIDTGIDYTHADFGGAGTAAVYQAARHTNTWSPTARVVGGYDFVGDDYDSSAVSGAGTAARSVPHPDANPIDCNGHGTHVAGTIAGAGVTADGQTFTGDYGQLTGADLYGMKVGPGMAPQASLYAFKVFGCSGTTDAVIPALDRALDPNGDGDFRDRLDVVDLSLSGPAAVQDPETTVLDAVARHGVLPVVAAGNGGDETDSAGSLATSTRSLVVASSVDASQQLDGLSVTVAGQPPTSVAGQMSTAYPWTLAADVSGEVVALSAADADGCAPLSAADKELVTGKIAWLTWDDDNSTRSCGSAQRAANIRAAGGRGILLTSAAPIFSGPVAGDAYLPVFQLTPAATAALQPYLDGGISVTFTGSLAGQKPEIDDQITDLVEPSTARGPHDAAAVKPDVAAPGDTVTSALMGSGTGGGLRSGTSMAAAEVAGIAALVRQQRPDWTPEQVKAAVINTADHDVYGAADRSGPALGPNRVGSGRIDAQSALETTLLAYNSGTAGGVSVNFGVVGADPGVATVTRTTTVVVQNTGTAAAQVALTYQAVTDQPGVTYQVNPSTLTVAPGSTSSVAVTMDITPSDLRHTLEAGTPAQQTNALTGLDEARQYLAVASGRLLLTSAGHPDLRVPVSGGAEPVSSTTAADGTVDGQPAVVLTGTGFSLSSPADSASVAYNSLTSVLNLGYRSNRAPACTARTATAGPAAITSSPPAPAAVGTSAACSTDADRSADLQAVGAGRTSGDAGDPGYLWFGLSTYGNWASAGKNMFPTVNIDTNGDNTADYSVQVQTVGDPTSAGTSDLLYALLFDDAGAGSLIGIYPVNFNLGAVDTNVFDTNVMLIPIDPTAIGYRPGDATFPIRYSVATYAAYGSPQNGGTVDTTPAIDFDVARPAITTGAPLWQDQGDTGIPYRLAAGTSAADALVLHLHGRDGARAEVVTLTGTG